MHPHPLPAKITTEIKEWTGIWSPCRLLHENKARASFIRMEKERNSKISTILITIS